MKHKVLDGHYLEWFVLILFFIVYVIISICHEPWFDEAQAWEIAKGASLKEVLFVIPHYEGHPPLWHMILSVPAKLGISFEVGLKTIGAIISVTTATLLIFRSKLPRVARLCLPFSYFFFYQYGVIVRPYGLMMLIMLILGMNMSQRLKHPWRIMLLLGLLCLCSAYGILISVGIAICFVIEILREKGFKQATVSLFKDSRTQSLLVLLILGVLLLLEILPRTETYYAAFRDRNPFWLCLVCAIFTFPAECFMTSASWFSVDRSLLQISNLDTLELIILCLIGIILWLLIVCSSSRKNLKFLLVPYFLIAAFSAKVYFSGHHLGIIFMFFLFWAEFISREEDRFELGILVMQKIMVNEKDYRLIKKAYTAIGATCLIVPIVWTIMASAREIKYDYYWSKSVAGFLNEHNLTELKILGEWREDGSLVPFSGGDVGYVNTVMIGTAVPVNAYFKNNVFYNLNHGNPSKGFIYHRRPSHAEVDSTLKEWLSAGYPDVIVGKPDLELVYGNKISYENYSLVSLVRSKFIWKAEMTSERMPIFLRNDLLNEYGLEALYGIEYTSINGIKITEEIKERFYNGESMEDILEPYFDVMFGAKNE